MTENDSFKEGEIIWAKIEGNPWWPSVIISKNKDIESNEDIYTIELMGSLTKGKLTKKSMAKFEKNYKYYSKAKNKELNDIIKQAKDINEIKDVEERDKKIKELISKNSINNINNIINNNESSSETSKTKEKSGIPKKKILKKKFEDKTENELIYKICNFLKNLTACLIRKDNSYNFEKNKGYIFKIFGFLKEYQIQDPIEFLKKTNLGKYIKYITEYVPNEEIKGEAREVYKSLENQVLTFLLRQK